MTAQPVNLNIRNKIGWRDLTGWATQVLLATTRNSFALLGIFTLLVMATLVARPDLRDTAEQQLLGWLLERQTTAEEVLFSDPDPTVAERATATNPKELPHDQAKLAFWLSRKYRVAPEPLGALVAEAYEIGQKVQIDPTLILAVMAIESRFNPFAQSHVGAQGLMQVLTRVHKEKYEDFGGRLAAFDPVTNLRVGVQVLQDCIRRAGSIEGGLRLYVGAVSTDGSDYIGKVLAEQRRLQSVALKTSPPPIRVSTPPLDPATALPVLPPLPGKQEIEAEASPRTTDRTVRS